MHDLVRSPSRPNPKEIKKSRFVVIFVIRYGLPEVMPAFAERKSRLSRRVKRMTAPQSVWGRSVEIAMQAERKN